VKNIYFLIFIFMLQTSNAQSNLQVKTRDKLQLYVDKISINIKPINKYDITGQYGNFRIKNSFPTNYEFSVTGIGPKSEIVLETEEQSIASLLINYRFNKLSLALSLDNLFEAKGTGPTFDILSFRAGSFLVPEINYIHDSSRVLKLGAIINF